MKAHIVIFLMPALIFYAALDVSCDVPTAYHAPLVRVAVIKDATQLGISIKSGFKIISIETGEVLCSGKILNHSTVVAMPGGGLKIGDMKFASGNLKIIPDTDSTILINNRLFRGEVQIVKQDGRGLLVVNRINVEDYLRGVLFHEVSHIWPKSVLEAQAIAARSFAIYQASANKNKDYDLESTVYSQVYGGAASEKFRADNAIDKTAGRVLVYKGEVLPAYYHATCAGHTEDAVMLWKTDLAPLRGVICNFCRQSPHFYWNKNIPVVDIESALSIEGIEDIIPRKWDSSGRIVSLQIKTQNDAINISGKDFRQKVGADAIKSTIFKIKIKQSFNNLFFAYIDGAGWGHGVGMCQWGAFGMARRGWRPERILEYYYPGSKIEIYSGGK